MQTATLDNYRQKLRDIRSDLVREFQADATAVAEDVQAPGDISHVPTHAADHDSEGVDERVALGEIERTLIDEIDEALRRIDQGTFGRCQSCGKNIVRDRLQAVPYTAYCLACAVEHEKELPPKQAIQERR